MKCDKYREIIELLADGKVSDEEKKKLLLHTNICETCRTEYESQVEYILVTSKLQRNIPHLDNKKEIIDEIIDMLDKQDVPKIKESRTIYLNNTIRKFVASVAAVLILLFSFQQISDAIKIKQLEEKQFSFQNKIDYSQLKLNVLANRLKLTKVVNREPNKTLGNKKFLLNLLLNKNKNN